MSTKACSQCMEDRPIEDYSGAQLKKKGKRVCTPCLTGAPSHAAQFAVDASSSSAANASSSAAAASTSGGFDQASPSAVIPVASPTPMPEGTYPPCSLFSTAPVAFENDIAYYNYESEAHLPLLTRLIERDLSEPYSIFTYRYFLNFWPKLTFLAMAGEECIGCVVCRLVRDKSGASRGYVAMLAVDTLYRKQQIGSRLVRLCIDGMRAANADVLVLEAEVTNKGALALYEKLNFVRESRLVKYYLSGSDAFRLKLWLKPRDHMEDTVDGDEE
jgi:peptide alpha-N-acetyltransferase